MAVSAVSRRVVRERAQLRCEYCHADERWQFIRFTIDQGQVVPIFNPRQEPWADHFAWDVTSIRVVGRTSTGRATIDLLDLNANRHDGAVLRIRQRDVSDGYHPPSEDPILSE